MSSSLLGLLQQLFVTALLFTALASAMTAIVYPRCSKRLARLEPARRARLITGIIVAPPLVGCLYTLLCFAPGLLAEWLPALDHCHTHAHADHLHLCFAHPDGGVGSALGWWLVLAGSCAVAWQLSLAARQSMRSFRALRPLLASAQRDAKTGALLVESAIPMAATTPLSPSILLSRGLLSALPARLLAAVVAHEEAHVRRRDPLRRLLLLFASVVQWPGTRRMLLQDLELACEQACDQQAALVVGDRALVAEALLLSERLLAAALPPSVAAIRPATTWPATTGFGGSNVVARIEALLGEQSYSSRVDSHPESLALLFALGLSIAATDPLHHLAEMFVSLL